MARTKSEIVEAMRRKRIAMWRNHMVLTRLIEGAALDRDNNLLEYVSSIRKKILVLKQEWLPKKLFHEQPANLFWVEGESKSVLYNYVPRGQRNVYQVAYTQVMMNATRAGMYFNGAKPEAIWAIGCCKFVCDKAKVFETDLVWTHDPMLKEWHRDRIEFFATKFTQQPKEQPCSSKTPTTNTDQLERKLT
jgi:hypothetical protein